MRHAGRVLALVGSILVGGLILLAFGSLFRVIREVNRPRPAKYPVQRMERLARNSGISSQIRQVFFVDLDVNAGIFLGRDVRLDPAQIRGGTYVEGSGQWGEVRLFPQKNGETIVAFCAATSRGEWRQAQVWFDEEVGRVIR